MSRQSLHEACKPLTLEEQAELPLCAVNLGPAVAPAGVFPRRSVLDAALAPVKAAECALPTMEGLMKLCGALDARRVASFLGATHASEVLQVVAAAIHRLRAGVLPLPDVAPLLAGKPPTVRKGEVCALWSNDGLKAQATLSIATEAAYTVEAISADSAALDALLSHPSDLVRRSVVHN